MTEPSNDEPTGYLADAGAPTELAGVADADTRAAHAWAFDDEPEPGPGPARQRFTPGLVTALVVAAAVVAIAAAAGVAVWFLRDAPVADPAPRPDLLNGVYSVEYHWDQATYRDVGGTTNWGDGADSRPSQDWLMLTSTCTDRDCIATGEVLGQGGVRVPGARRLTFKLTNGLWQDIAPARVKSTCTYGDGSIAGESWTTVTLGFTPRPDGSFTGALTTVVDTNECGDQGNTVVTPLTARKVGE